MDPFSIAAGLGGFLGRHWKVLAFAGVVAVAGVQSWRVDRLKADVREERAAQVNPETGERWKVEAQRDAAALKTCRGNVGRLEADVGRQNAAIDAWKAEGDRLEAAAAKARQDLRGARAVAESRSRAVLDVTVAGATCEAREAAMLSMAEEMLK